MLSIGPLNDLPGIRHAFFERTGGVSEGLYTSLNCGFGSGDEADRVAENRTRALAQLELEPDGLVTAYQVHSNRVAVVESPWPREAAPKVDAMVSRIPQLALGRKSRGARRIAPRRVPGIPGPLRRSAGR